MRRFGVTVISVLIFLFCSVTLASAESMMLEYDGGTHEYNGEVYSLVVNNRLINSAMDPIIFNDRALVPVREIFEEVGATVNYIGDTQTVEVIDGDSHVALRINDNVAYINGDKTNIPDNVVPKLIAKVGGETKTMVPVRFISETIGLDVEFDAEDGAILIDSNGYTLAEGLVYEEPVFEEPVYEEPVYEEPVVIPYVTDVSYDTKGDKNIKVTVRTDADIESYTYFDLTSPGRVVLDIAGARIGKLRDTIIVNEAGVSTIRLGDNQERARIVVDVERLDSYDAEKIASDTIEISIKTKGASVSNTVNESEKNPSSYTAQPSSSKLIVLDAGHGGEDSGAVGYLDGNKILEKELTLEITYKVKDILEGAGYTVSMTRTGDTLPSLVERPTQANAENAAVFVSVHINSAEATQAHGTEVFYANENNGDSYGTTSQQLAQNILDRMLYYMGSTNRGVKCAEHAVTRRCKMPAALAEVGFISNAAEVYQMTTDEYQSKAAQGIAEGIIITLRDITIPN
ncbi:MAG: N-acetylmuramoyl-L-alanine amidase [Oscillospiraceae bacterium]|nr:N-acetylmuramoyl-L-alanine amidase [Oscillospiraceae bacterium]